MLHKIIIQNFALIDHLELDLHKGLQVITGETGAGKSIILGALRLILGERADLKSIKNQENKTVVEAEFEIDPEIQVFFDENDLDYEPKTIIRREILPSGKSRSFVNDVPVTLDILKQLTCQLIDIHSQFETSDLFTEKFQFDLLDGLCGQKNTVLEYQKSFSEYKTLLKKQEEYNEQLQVGNKEADYQNFIFQELLDAQLDDLDFDALQTELSTLENAEKIAENVRIIINRFHQDEIGVLEAGNEIKSKLNKTAEYSELFATLSERFEQLWIEIKDWLNELENQAEKVNINPEGLLQLQEKSNKIHSLFLKHQVNSLAELIEIRNEIAQKQNNFSALEELIEKNEKQIKSLEQILEKQATKLHQNRTKASKVFEDKMHELLGQLGLKKAKLKVELLPKEHFDLLGKESIEIYFQANSGFPLKPIQNAISGGERSRVMLAIKKIMAENNALPTLILDEIDTGVSGKIANEMGKLMKEMSHDLQLIVITHLAQVAAKGSNNYKVIKQDTKGKTYTLIKPLNTEEKRVEIAQLLSGAEITDAALQQAEELMR